MFINLKLDRSHKSLPAHPARGTISDRSRSPKLLDTYDSSSPALMQLSKSSGRSARRAENTAVHELIIAHRTARRLMSIAKGRLDRIAKDHGDFIDSRTMVVLDLPSIRLAPPRRLKIRSRVDLINVVGERGAEILWAQLGVDAAIESATPEYRKMRRKLGITSIKKSFNDNRDQCRRLVNKLVNCRPQTIESAAALARYILSVTRYGSPHWPRRGGHERESISSELLEKSVGQANVAKLLVSILRSISDAGKSRR